MKLFSYIAAMFIRVVKKKNTSTGKTFCQYQLCQSSRIDGKVKQYSILYLGSNALLEEAENRKMLAQLMKALISGQSLLFNEYPSPIVKLAEEYYEKFRIKYKDVGIDDVMSIPPVEGKAQMQEIDINTVEIEDSRTFGGEYLCKQMMEKLGLGQCMKELGFSQQQIDLAHISIISRALFTASEHKTAQYLATSSALKALYGYESQTISHKNLYPIADLLYRNKNKIDKFVYGRISHMFNLKDSLVIYDLSNTYFEGRKQGSELARYGKNKDKRDDCKQVVFTGVINAEGFIRYCRIYEGNKADITTIEDMVGDLEGHSDNISDKTVVMDAGFASDDNLAYLSSKGLKYICVSRHRIKDYSPVKQGQGYRIYDKRNNAIDLKLFTPGGYDDLWMQVISSQKRIKETSMASKLEVRFEQAMQSLSEGLNKKGTTKRAEKVWERIGRIKEKHNRVSGRYNIDVAVLTGKAVKVSWEKKPVPLKDGDQFGLYFIRTNYLHANEKQLWDIYNTIREVESTFRCLKSDLNLRPVYHQNDERVESHIYLAILAYQLINTIRYMLKENSENIQGQSIRHDWRNIVRIMNTQKIQSVLLNTKTRKICLRKPSRPIKEALNIYKATNTKSMIPAKKKYVVYH